MVNKKWSWKILWLYETYFSVDGAVNSQNCLTWGSARLYVVHERSSHSDYITVWCGFKSDFILGRFFFEQNTSQSPKWCSITSSRYCNLFQKYIIPVLRQQQCSESTVFMQFGAPPHIAREMTAL